MLAEWKESDRKFKFSVFSVDHNAVSPVMYRLTVTYNFSDKSSEFRRALNSQHGVIYTFLCRCMHFCEKNTYKNKRTDYTAVVFKLEFKHRSLTRITPEFTV